MDKYSLISVLFLLFTLNVQAQDMKEMRDTLNPSRVVSDKSAERDAGTRIVKLPSLRTMVSATGEADAIRYIQTLPGVSTGTDGSSAIYVRGGNIGSNLTTLDGVTLYGGSHFLGLASSYPTDIISSISFRLGGFHGDEGNLTSSHIGLITSDGNFTERKAGISVSNFIIGAKVSTPLIKDRVSLLASVRVSPLGAEFRGIQSLVGGGALDSLTRVGAMAYDLFAKVKWLRDADNTYSFSAFNSMDAYRYCYGRGSDESLGWNNMILNLRHEGNLNKGWKVDDGISYNRFSNRQGIVRDMNGTINNLAIVSSLDELTADMVYSRSESDIVDLRIGVRERLTWFNPGTSATFKSIGPLLALDSPRSDHISHSSITTAHIQANLHPRERLSLMMASRLNAYLADEHGIKRLSLSVNPELSIMANIRLADWLSFEATSDWTVQYHHTLEGIPIGWSVDLIVPSNPVRPPERARQYYAGILSSFGQHRFTIGAYDKKMHNLVYFLDASKLFSYAMAGWSENIKVGKGTSRGVEFLYEKDGNRFDWHLAYTLSNTDRQFDKVNNNLRFPAKFDRRHVLNATVSCKITDNSRRSILLTGMYTWQSGHWETVAAGEYPVYSMTGEESSFNYFTKVNNYEMPPSIRLDLGCSFVFKTRLEQTLNIGVYNVMNRHNPISVIYDDRDGEWKQVSLIPIMPSLSWRVEF